MSFKLDPSVDRLMSTFFGLVNTDEPINFVLVPAMLVALAVGFFLHQWLAPLPASIEEESPETGTHRPKKQRRRNRSPWKGQEDPKMVLLVRKDLKLKGTDIACTAATAATGAVEIAVHGGNAQWGSWKTHWDDVGVAKVALAVPDEPTLDELERKAKADGLPCFLAQIDGKKAVLAVGPAPISSVDEISGHLKLL